MMGILAQMTGVFGAIIYQKYLKDIEIKKLLNWSLISWSCSAFCQHAFAKRWNTLIGLNDFGFVMVTDTFLGAISVALT